MRGEDTRLVTSAARFAAEKHADQRRKGSRQKPYFNHLAEVADLLAEATVGDDAALIAAGFLHDTIEDTATTADELKELFGADILSLVLEVTALRIGSKVQKMRGEAKVDGQITAEAEIMCIIGDRPQS